MQQQAAARHVRSSGAADSANSVRAAAGPVHVLGPARDTAPFKLEAAAGELVVFAVCAVYCGRRLLCAMHDSCQAQPACCKSLDKLLISAVGLMAEAIAVPVMRAGTRFARFCAV
jgi:hypothetical protein